MALMAARPRNILLLVVDSLRHDSVGYARDRRFHEQNGLSVTPDTPTLDRLAREGTFCTQALTVSSTTASAHASLLTSRLPAETGIETWVPQALEPDLQTLSMAMAEAGYRTVHAVDFSALYQETELNRGAQHVLLHDDARLLELLASKREGIFLYMQLGDVHAPYLRSFEPTADRQPYRERYAWLRRRYGIPELDDGFRQAVADGLNRPWPGARGVTRWVMDDFATLKLAMQQEGEYFKTIFPLYQEGVNRFDRTRLARFLAGLEAHGLLEDTFLTITSGHGISTLGPNNFDHSQDLADGAIRVPLIFHYPGVIHERHVIDAPVTLLDVAPTLLDLAGVTKVHGPLRGYSLREALLGSHKLPNDRALYAEHWRTQPTPEGQPGRQILAQRVMRTDRFKLILQGRDLMGDEQVLHLVDPHLDMKRFVDAVNHRFLGLEECSTLETFIRARQRNPDGEQVDILNEVLLLARSTFPKDRYQTQHKRRLRSLLAERIQHHYQQGGVDMISVAQDFYEAWFLEFPPPPVLQKIALMMRHHAKSVGEIFKLFESLGPPVDRYRFYDLEMDPSEQVNLCALGLSVPQERDCLAIEILLIENWLQGRGLADLRHGTHMPPPTIRTLFEALP